MQIQEIFKKDINRNINGVIKAEQQDIESIYTELDEYVVTRELKGHFDKFFDNYLSVIEHRTGGANNIGVWIAGFFGSGKSHFLKILSYLLENKEVSTPEHPDPKTAYSFFEEKITDPMTLANLKRVSMQDTDAILFNIDTHAKAGDREDAILNVFYKAFNEYIGYSGDFPHLARLEAMLDSEGKYDLFKESFEEITGLNWIENRDSYDFYFDEVVEALIATGKSSETAKKLIENLEENTVLSIDNFCEWVRDYLDAHPGKNVAFLVDEVGQFIGNNTSMMLKLQTIVEDLGVKCAGRAWVVVTSQANIDEAIGYLDRQQGNDFSKIQGRFPTRISLSSSNTEEVIQKRLLEKREEAIAPLTTIFEEKGDILRSQLSFGPSTTYAFKEYTDAGTFVKNYPFIPYHFVLVQNVFESIREKGATGKHLAMGERSLLDAFQSATKQIRTEGLDQLVPFYRFYAPIEGFLEPAIKRAFEQARDNPKLIEEDIDLLKTLFLIRYVDKVKSTFDNIVVLSIDHIDQDIKALRERIKGSLERLEEQYFIARTAEEFVFLTNEEKEIENEIRKQDVVTSDITVELSRMIFDELLSDSRKIRHKNGQDFPVSRFCNGHTRDGNELYDLIFRILTPLDPDYGTLGERDYILKSSEENQGVLVRLSDQDSDSDRLWKDLEHYVKTELFLKHHPQTDGNRQLLMDKAAENRERRKRVLLELKDKMLSANIYSAGSKLENSFSDVNKLYSESLNHYLENTFKQLKTLKTLTSHPDRELKAILTSPDTMQLSIDGVDTTEMNREALELLYHNIQLLISMNGRVTIENIVDRFSKKPYGWPDGEILILLARLIIQGKVRLEYESSPLTGINAYEKLNNSRFRRQILVTEIKQNSENDINNIKAYANNFFGKPFNHLKAEELDGAIRAELNELNGAILKYSEQQKRDTRLPGKKVLTEGKILISNLIDAKDSYTFNTNFLSKASTLQKFLDEFVNVKNFYESQIELWLDVKEALELTYASNKRHLLYRSPETEEIFKNLENILAEEEPYTLMSKVRVQLVQLDRLNNELLIERRENALEHIEKRINELEIELDRISANADLRNRVLQEIQKIRKQVQDSLSVDAILSLQHDSKQAFESGFEKINDVISRAQRSEEVRKARQAQVGAKDDLVTTNIVTSSGRKGEDEVSISQEISPDKPEAEDALKAKIIERVALSSLVREKFNIPTIETDVELTQLMQKLEKELSSILKAGKRIRFD